MAQVVKVGLLGLGTVGSGVYRILTQGQGQLEEKTGIRLLVKKILVRNPKRRRSVTVEAGLLTTEPGEVLKDPEIDLVVEVLGGEEPARTMLAEALKAGKSVVTANKEVIAKHGSELLALAQQGGVDLFFEASVGGGIPILEPLQSSLLGEDIESVCGIVNGTTNYILTAMTEEGRSYGDVLQEAQSLGYAEADPTADVAGHDAARKLAILAALAFDKRLALEEIYCEGIEEIQGEDISLAAKLGYAIKLVARAQQKDKGIEAGVYPALVPLDHPLAGINGVTNAVIVEGRAVGSLLFAGAGAGQMPTGSAVVRDLVMAAKGLSTGERCRGRLGFVKDARIIPQTDVKSAFYLRLEPKEAQGILAKVNNLFAAAGVELRHLELWEESGRRNLLIKTGQVAEGVFWQALKGLQEDEAIGRPAAVMRLYPE